MNEEEFYETNNNKLILEYKKLEEEMDEFELQLENFKRRQVLLEIKIVYYKKLISNSYF